MEWNEMKWNGGGYFGGGVNYNTNLKFHEIFPDTYPVVVNIPLVHIWCTCL